MTDNGVKILIAVLGLLGIVISYIVAPIVKAWIENKKSAKTRAASALPDIMGTTWEAEWDFQDGTPYTRESVTLEKWIKDFEFQGYGFVVHAGKQYKYSITGVVSPARVVALIWTAEGFPTKGANLGTACLQLSPGSNRLDGNWAGLAQADDKLGLYTGSVRMKKIKDSF